MYIQSANHISAQKPLSDEWFDNPIFYDELRVRTIDPDYTGHFPPMVARRMGKLLKRVAVLSRLALKEASVEMPDAIISGTGLSCIENTEKFLYSIMENDEKFLQPTHFMQSTHNVLSTSIAMDLKCHGYNNSYVHRGTSFEYALLDTLMQFEQKRIKNVLVGGFDELTDDYFIFFERIGVWDFVADLSAIKKCFAAEAAVSMLLDTVKRENTICEINDVELMYKPTAVQLRKTLDAMLEKVGCEMSDIDAVLTGLNSHVKNDNVYYDTISQLFGDRPILQYKHLFGESFAAPALGVYAAATCLRKGRIPAFMISDAGAGAAASMSATAHTAHADITDVKRILLYNHCRNKSHSLILLSSC